MVMHIPRKQLFFANATTVSNFYFVNLQHQQYKNAIQHGESVDKWLICRRIRKNMNIRKIAFIFLAAGVIAAAVVNKAVAQNAKTTDLDQKYASGLLKPGTTAPEFSLPTPDGKLVKLSDSKGSYVLLDFWASWCPDCRRDAPAIVALHDKYAKKGVKFIGVSFDTNKEAWKAALDKLGIKYTQVGNLKKWKETQVSKEYKISWIPTIYIIDPQGKVALATVMPEKAEAFLQKTFAK